MGQNQSLQYDESKEMEEVRLLAEKEGPAAVHKYIQEHMDGWKSAEVLFGVTGRSATGKSSFINAIRNIKAGEEGFAKAGSGDTTTEPSRYPCKNNKQIVYVDLAGVGTLKFPRTQYFKTMKIHEYDFIFIFFDKVLSEDDLWLAEELQKIGKPFCFVRSKIDLDLANAEDDGKIAANVIPEIKKKIEDGIKGQEVLKLNKAVFLISSKNKNLGQWNELLDYMNDNLGSFKREAVLCSIPNITNRVLDSKYKMLKRRLKMASALAILAGAIPIPGVDLVANIAILVEEIRHYIQVFGLSKQQVDSLEGFDKSQLSCEDFLEPVDMAKVLIPKIGLYATFILAENALDLILPFIGSAISGITSGIMTYRCLSGILSDLKNDALCIYEHLAQQTN